MFVAEHDEMHVALAATHRPKEHHLHCEYGVHTAWLLVLEQLAMHAAEDATH